MENNKENKELMQDKIIPCCFSEVNEKGQHITNCKNLPTELDKDNIQIRYFCKEHMIKVESIRRKMAEKYIKEYEEKILNELFKIDCELNKHFNLYNSGHMLINLINKIQNGNFR